MFDVVVKMIVNPANVNVAVGRDVLRVVSFSKGEILAQFGMENLRVKICNEDAVKRLFDDVGLKDVSIQVIEA